ncbi:DUF3238 domain-containing protein [Geobacillus stearothermophilus]|uniref:DUF3238 domain-containing protein n=1 Tax=Geobacillus stearothermophilus TaxID=1422 RepID=UPI002EB2DC1D|nr:DUF3238 domain-containing protein [Geobacillus stearothermophilus]
MKKQIIPILIAVGFMLLSQQEADAKDLGKVKSIRGNNSIQMVLENDLGDYYKVYRDGKKIWEGSKEEFVDNNLEPDYYYNYKIGVYKNNKLIDIISHKVKTKDKNLNKKKQEEHVYAQETDIVTTIGQDYVTLEWEPIADDDGIYEVYRDGEFLASVNSTSYTDTTVKNGEDYLYEIVAKKEVSAKQKKQIEEYIKNNQVDISELDKEQLFKDIKTVGKLVETVKELSEEELTTLDIPEELQKQKSSKKDSNVKIAGIPDIGAEYPAYIFRYTTFIPYAKVDNPNAIHEGILGEYGTQLKGDNRGFDPFSNKYRTRVDVYTTWWYNDPELFYDRFVGESVLYDSKGNVLLRGTASPNGIKVTKDLVSSTKMMWRVNHDVGVPFHSSYPNITYYYEATVYKNGNFSIRGSHDKAPNHEIYAGNAYTDLRPLTVYTYAVSSTADFAYLFPGTPQKYFEVSM